VASHGPLEPGGIILLGTDGIWETSNAQGQLFGKKRLQDIFRAHAARSAQEILGAVEMAVASFRGDHPQEDDITLVVIKTLDIPPQKT